MSKASNVILVRGAWADGSSWSKVIPLLLGSGLRVTAAFGPGAPPTVSKKKLQKRGFRASAGLCRVNTVATLPPAPEIRCEARESMKSRQETKTRVLKASRPTHVPSALSRTTAATVTS
jgi:hypothetical protein